MPLNSLRGTDAIPSVGTGTRAARGLRGQSQPPRPISSPKATKWMILVI